MTSDEDMIRFHNGDTLESIPVVRIDEPERRKIPWRTVGGVLGTALFVGGLVGLSIGMGEGKSSSTVAAPDEEVAPSVSSSPSAGPPPAPVPTVTVTQQQPTPTVTVTQQTSEAVPAPYVEPSMEQVYIIAAPFTGGDPGTNYCVSYTGGSNSDGALAILQANVPAYQCRDYLFSTHPDDEMGVFETMPPDCSATPGGRTAQLLFDPTTEWGDGVLYTCLLLNDGA